MQFIAADDGRRRSEDQRRKHVTPIAVQGREPCFDLGRRGVERGTVECFDQYQPGDHVDPEDRERCEEDCFDADAMHVPEEGDGG